MITTYIGLGSNLLHPLEQLRNAVRAIAALPQSRLAAVSTAYRSRAVGPGEQPDYLNAVLRLETTLEPGQLLAALQDIERAQGRERSVRWGPRTLDLDILLYGDALIDSPALTIPHPALHTRNFVLYPLEEVSGPDLRLPAGDRLGNLLDQCPRGELLATGLHLGQ